MIQSVIVNRMLMGMVKVNMMGDWPGGLIRVVEMQMLMEVVTKSMEGVVVMGVLYRMLMGKVQKIVDWSGVMIKVVEV